MKLNRLFTAGALVISAMFSLVANAQVSELEKLKLYRTYYTLKMESLEAHQIEVFFQSPDEEGVLRWDSNRIGIQVDQDLTKLTAADFVTVNTAIAGWLTPPKEFETLPPTLENKRPDIEAAFKRIFSTQQLTNFVIVYSGYRALVNVDEYVPITKTEPAPNEPVLWVGNKSERQYFVDLKANTLDDVGSSGSGYGLMFYDITTAEEVAAIQWWNFALPESIEGSALFSMDYIESGVSPLHQSAYADLKNSILEATRLIQNGGSVYSPLDAILARQGSTVLPPQFLQYMTYELSIYGRVSRTAGAQQLSARIEFAIPFTDGEISLQQHDAKSELTAKLEGRFFGPNAGFTLTVTDPNGKSVSSTMTVLANELKLTEVEGKKMAPYVTLSEAEEFELPGRGNYTSFDIYPENSMNPFRLVGGQ